MAFLLSGWGTASVDLNIPVQTIGSVVYGTNRIFTYQSSTDAQATISASGYFNSVAYQITTNDLVYAVGSDSNVWYQLTNTSGVITTSGFNLAGPVGTANLSSHAVTYAKMQQAATVTLLGNPTGGTHDLEEITLANPLVFSGTTLGVAPQALQYATGTLSAANWAAMYGAPVQILAATVAGSGKVIIVDSFDINYTFVAAGYTGGGATLLQYGNTTHGGGIAATSTLAAAGFSDQTASMSVKVAGALAVNATASLANTGIYISNQTAAFATGDGTFTYYLRYHVVAMS